MKVDLTLSLKLYNPDEVVLNLRALFHKTKVIVILL